LRISWIRTIRSISNRATLISLTEDMPTTRDKEVLSKEELDNEREEKG
jgi:hypothetical protein